MIKSQRLSNSKESNKIECDIQKYAIFDKKSPEPMGSVQGFLFLPLLST